MAIGISKEMDFGPPSMIIEIPKPTQTMSEIDIQNLVMAFRALTMNPSYRNSLQKLSKPDILDNIILITPGLSQDPVAISMIQDPELLIRMGDVDTVRRIVELHPALAEAANHIAAAVHEEAFATPQSTQPSTSSGYSYSLDALSDDDEMDSSQNLPYLILSADELDDEAEEMDEDDTQSSDSQPVGARHAITAAQLANAIASAHNSGTGLNPEASGITSEMVSQAMQQAIAASVIPRSPSTGAVGATEAMPPPAVPTQDPT